MLLHKLKQEIELPENALRRKNHLQELAKALKSQGQVLLHDRLR